MSTSSVPPPPTSDVSNPVNDARLRLRSLSSMQRLSRAIRSKPKRLSVEDTDEEDLSASSMQRDITIPVADIDISHSASSDADDVQDSYQWAIVYENQRGCTLGHFLYYSSSLLVPYLDPHPYSLPTSGDHFKQRRHRPNFTLEHFPLPDGRWRWVSKAWMIDMGSDNGQYQHDGFQYNRFFQAPSSWSPHPGNFGGFVRRRRWIRLMVRPARAVARLGDGSDSPTQQGQRGLNKDIARSSVASAYLPPSVSDTDELDDVSEAAVVWAGDMADWGRCQKLLRRHRDGEKLELWQSWLGLDGNHSSASIQHIKPVLREQGRCILYSFVYPDSRSRFVSLIRRAGLLDCLEQALSKPTGEESRSEGLSTEHKESHATAEIYNSMDFWSYR